MKTMNEKAIDYCLEVKGQIHQEFIDDFEAGYKAAQEWISVDDELPKKREWILVRINESYGTMRIQGDCDMKFFLANVIVWRPIN